ncbi:MAG TPA: DUF3592 domain-containing protein [Anaerolineales bacterium]|nr:DUF3592 domain-containing protein [Anaerolineales bacterium]
MDGKQYQSLDDIPDETDRLKFEAMVNGAFDAEFDAEFAKLDEEVQQIKGPSIEKINLTVFTGIAILMLLIAAIATLNNLLKISREESAPGHGVEIISRREYINEQDRVFEEYYYPVVEFVSANGKAHKVQLNEGISRPSHEVGDEVVILYEPKHPLDARIKSFGSSALMWILPGITGILEIAFLGAVLVVHRLIPPGNETTGSPQVTKCQ